jgi:hypothetical protein
MDLGGLLRRRPPHESRIAIKVYRVLRVTAAKVGLDVVLRTFYSPVPRLDQLPPDIFDRVSQLPGLRWDLDAQIRFLDRQLSGFVPEFNPPASTVEGSDRYGSDNPSYSLLDATVHYGMVRALRSRRVVELGSGHSTLVTVEAARMNAAEGAPLTLSVFDPFPNLVRPDLPGLDEFHRTPAQDVPLAVFEELEDGDILFVDTTHTVKLGSEVNFILLEVLPRLRPGVVAHVHDVFLPFEYPSRFMQDFGLYWSEQYLLQAFLAHNDQWDVLAAVHALRRLRRIELEGILPREAVRRGGGGFWMRRQR